MVKDAAIESLKEIKASLDDKDKEPIAGLISKIGKGLGIKGALNIFLQRRLGRQPTAKELKKAKDAREAYIEKTSSTKKKKPSLFKTEPNPQQDTPKVVLDQNVAQKELKKRMQEMQKEEPPKQSLKAGGVVKGKKKSVKPKKKSVAGRLAKRGYGAARR